MNWRFFHAVPISLCLLAAPVLGPLTEAATTICVPDNASEHTGSVYGPAPQDSEIVAWRTPRGSYRSYDHEVGYTRFNISPVPDDVMIIGVTIHYYIHATSGHAHYKLTPLELDPLVTSDWWIRWDICSDSSSRRPYSSSVSDDIGWHEKDLGSRGIHNLRQGLDAGWFGVGFHNYESGIRIDGWAEANTPYLVVEHRPGPLTYHVDDNGPFDPGPGDPTVSDPAEDGSAAHPFDSIQEAVDAAYWDGGSVVETVMVADGLYTGEGNRDIDLDGNVLHIRSANGPENCIIDCQGSAAEPHRGFYLRTGGTYTVLEGFTITGGYEDDGGAIYCTSAVGQPISRPVIRGNVITGNTASSSSSARGGGIYGGTSISPLITGNVITDNTATAPTYASGGGVYYSSSAVTGNLITGNRALGTYAKGGGVYAGGNVSNNIVTGNHADYEGGGILCMSYSQPTIFGTVANNVVSGNTAAIAAGIAYGDILSNCTVTGNIASDYAGGLLLINNSVITDCIIEGNEALHGNEIVFGGNTHDVSYSNIDRDVHDIYEGSGAVVNWGPGMLDADPGFAAGADGEFYLGQTSAGQLLDSVCLDAGSTQADQVQIPLAWTMTDGTMSWAPIADRTTATNFDEDTDTLDMGFHYPALPTVTSQLNMVPAVGILPFSPRITTILGNNYTGQSRRVAGHLDVLLAGGGSYTNWRSGWANIDAGSNYTATWMQFIPALPALVGENAFTLHTWDVTPAPYNQPPYPAAGDSDSDTATVTGIAP